MTRLPLALACLILALILAAVGYVLARPRWRWERPEERELCREPRCWTTLGHSGPHHGIDGIQWSSTGSSESVTRPSSFTTSPESVTWSTDNGTGFDPRLMGV